jgi:hypothetical protein
VISIQPLDRFWQEPEPSQATGMALALCILGKFLGVVCHFFPLPLDAPTFAARCLHVPNNTSRKVELWAKMVSGNFAEMMPCLCHLGIFYTTQIYGTGPTALLPGKVVQGKYKFCYKLPKLSSLIQFYRKMLGGAKWQENVYSREEWKKLLRTAGIVAFCTCEWNESNVLV